jgi:hypothetical protein
MHMPISKPPQQQTLHEELTSTSPEDKSGSSCAKVDPDFPKQIVPHLKSQSGLTDLVRDLNLSKIHAELLASHGIFYNRVLKCDTGNATNRCHHFIF